MANFCGNCGKKSTQKRIINQNTSLCNECTPPIDQKTVPTIDPDCMMGELCFRDFRDWFKNEVDVLVSRKVKEETGTLSKEILSVKNENKLMNDELKKLKIQVDALVEEVKEMKNENETLKKTGDNNLKYLVNLDRNIRRSNIMVMGVSESTSLKINPHGRESTTDKDKITDLLNYLEVNDQVEIVNSFRCGKEADESEGKIRPIKIEMKNGEMVGLILSKAKKLKDLNLKIYFKPDKTVKEREEFQRLFEKKKELMISHPTDEGNDDRVTLIKGVLKVDGRIVDRYNSPQTIF